MKKSVDGFVFRHADTVTCELKLKHADRLAEWYLASKLVQALVGHVVSGFLNSLA